MTDRFSTDNMSARLVRWMAALVVAVLVTAPALGAEPSNYLERIEAIYLRAEHDNRAALKDIVALGQELGPDTPYVVQRHYLKTRFGVEMEAADNEAAMGSIAKLARLAQEQQDDLGRVLAVSAEASLMSTNGKSAGAIARLAEIASAAERMADAETLAYYHRVMGNAQLAVGKFEDALNSCLQSLKYAEQQQQHSVQSRLNSLNNLSNVYSAMKNPEKALDIINQALALAMQRGQKSMLASLYINQGGAFASLGRTDEYMAANERALKISRDGGLVLTEAVVLNNISDSWLIKRDYLKAETYARLAVAKYTETGEQSGLATAQANLGFALIGQKKISDGVLQVRRALAVLHDSGDISGEEGVLGELGRMYEQAGLYREAVATIREQQALSSQLFKADRERSVATLQEQFDSVQRERQIELLAKENSLKDFEIKNQRLQQVVTVLGAMVAVFVGAFVYSLYRRSRVSNMKLREANKQLEFHSVRDALTGLLNRRSFFDLMKKRPADSVPGRREGDFADGLMILDIDHFKSINDTLGHGAGDSVLIEVANRLRDAVRDTDKVIRWGGEEFLVYSPKANPTHLRNLAERILNAVGEKPIAVAGRVITVTLSGGFLTLPFSDVPESECNWEKAMQIADMALYMGKVNGRNRIYGVCKLLAPFAEALPVLENDIAGALSAGMVELVEVVGPEVNVTAPRLSPEQ